MPFASRTPGPPPLEAALEALVATAREGATVLPRPPAFGAALARLRATDWERPAPELAAVVAEALAEAEIHPAGRRYFGMPHGTPSVAAVLGAALAAAHDPELATRHHAPFGVGAERELAAALTRRLMPGAEARGHFTTGASEANLAAVLLALCARFPAYPRRGLCGVERAPRIYASADAHPSVQKAARVAGLGTDAVRLVAVDRAHRMRPDALADAIGRDRRERTPLLVVATAGTTTVGALDPLPEVGTVARRAGCWLHVDAAYGGMLALAPGARHELAGIEAADSVAFDPHKTLDVPLGLGLFCTRRPELLRLAFGVSARYLPRAADEPWATTLGWSRPFRALPLLLALGARGLSGVASAVEHKLALGRRLGAALRARGFEPRNETPLPVVCFVDARVADGGSARHLAALAESARQRAGAYLPLVRLPDGAPVLRACVTSERTTGEDVEALVAALDAGR
ncbi:MAG: aminotransferase class V-fold PLP-dependent enzyme [Polyangiaceae bacterium]|nr:aminotransferase class V-fold PLP-dependent enzyme [Polyangiaceae bacterium]